MGIPAKSTEIGADLCGFSLGLRKLGLQACRNLPRWGFQICRPLRENHGTGNRRVKDRLTTPADRSRSVGFNPGVTHETRRAWRPLRRVFGLSRASVCGSGLKGRFPVAQGAALGQGHPQKIVFRPEGPISRRVLFSCSCSGFPGGSAETGPSSLVRVFWGCRACVAIQARRAVFR